MGARPRRRVDEEIATLSMNGVLVGLLCFVMMTSTWERVGLLDARVTVTRLDDAPAATPLELHVRLHGETCVMAWREAGREMRRTETRCVPQVERFPGTRYVRVRYEGLVEALAVEAEASPRWTRPESARPDELVLHVDDDVTYAYIAGAIDAASGVRRTETLRGRLVHAWAFRVSLATD
jgi:hypothetical protein